jgi:hypothetical protein
MRIAAFVLVSGSLLVIAIAACTHPPAQNLAGEDPTVPAPAPEGPETTAKTSTTCLGKEGLGFEKPKCDECMNAAACCQATLECFKDNVECTALQGCMAKCGGTGSIPR